MCASAYPDCGHPGEQRLYRGVWRCDRCLNSELMQVSAPYEPGIEYERDSDLPARSIKDAGEGCAP